MQLLAAFDKFRGSLTAKQACDAAVDAASDLGWNATSLPMADGGEGTLEALGGPNRSSMVAGPLGGLVSAEWRLQDGLAVIEMARASGLALVGGAVRNDPVRTTTRGTGELIREAIEEGARRIVVGVGGSATTDGGWGAVQTLGSIPDDVEIEVACDVTTLFLEAARVYGPQKGATDRQIEMLTQRLEDLAGTYAAGGTDIRDLPGSGAAGGLGGGLASLGARLRSGFDVVAESAGLDDHLDRADMVVTGEGRLDPTSWQGKVVGGVVSRSLARRVPVFLVVGSADPDSPTPPDVPVRSIVELLGTTESFSRAVHGVRALVAEQLTQLA